MSDAPAPVTRAPSGSSAEWEEEPQQPLEQPQLGSSSSWRERLRASASKLGVSLKEHVRELKAAAAAEIDKFKEHAQRFDHLDDPLEPAPPATTVHRPRSSDADADAGAADDDDAVDRGPCDAPAAASSALPPQAARAASDGQRRAPKPPPQKAAPAVAVPATPWAPTCPRERRYEREFRAAVLKIAKEPAHFLAPEAPPAEGAAANSNDDDDDDEAPPPPPLGALLPQAAWVVEVDDDLRQLRFQLVPRELTEEQFWRRYFAAVRRVKRSILLRGAAREAALDQGLPFEATARSKPAVPRASAAISSRGIYILARAVGEGRPARSLQQMCEPGLSASPPPATMGLAARALSASRHALGQLTAARAGSGGGRWELDPEELGALYTLFDSEAPSASAYGHSWSRLAEELGGAPPAGFLACVTMVFAAMERASAMALFWLHAVEEIRWHWQYRQPIPRVDVEQAPQLNYCLIHQKLQLINCCIARLKRREVARRAIARQREEARRRVQAAHGAAEALGQAGLDHGAAADSGGAQGQAGPSVDEQLAQMRWGHKEQIAGLVLIRSGEPLFAPHTQEAPVLTEDMMRETEELMMKTGSLGVGVAQLRSDMSAFKAANPQALLEDFVRWYSPPDWIPEVGAEARGTRGCLSARMQEEGNLWRQLWEVCPAAAAAEQSSLFDEEHVGEAAIDFLATVAPSELLETAFIVALGSAYAGASASPAAQEPPLREALEEVLQFAAALCGRGMSATKIDRLCAAFDRLESFVRGLHADEVEEWTLVSPRPDADGEESPEEGQG
mmetsp:Transcript_10501/g.38649  ORF Transcript_10501/g.38649 Transcript_10501/m.38649 type:complete len:792 (-) Transcript_10501:209-2584(-)